MNNNNLLSQLGILQGDYCFSVDGINGAEQFNMGPNSRVPLFDKNNDIMFIKTTDANGQYGITTFDFSKREEAYPEKYLTAEKFEQYMQDFRKELLNNAQFTVRNKTNDDTNDQTQSSNTIGNTALNSTKRESKRN